MKGRILAICAVCAALLWAQPASAAVVGITTWDDGTLGGWTGLSNAWGRWEVSTTGGNPGGYVRLYDLDSNNPASQLHAAGPFLGDLSAIPNARFEWDMSAGRTAAIGTTILLSGPGGTAFYDTPKPGTSWGHYGVDIQLSAWTVSQGTWAGLITNVTDISIVGDICSSHPGVELMLDNFALMPEPATILLVALSGLWLVRRR